MSEHFILILHLIVLKYIYIFPQNVLIFETKMNILSSFPHYLEFKTCMSFFLRLNTEEDNYSLPYMKKTKQKTTTMEVNGCHQLFGLIFGGELFL